MSESQYAAISRRLEKIEHKLDEARIDIAGLKVKAGLWGGMAAIIAAVGMKLMENL